MRGLVVCLALVVIGGVSIFKWGDAQEPTIPAAVSTTVKPVMMADGLIALSSDTADRRQLVTVIDSRTKVISVYHIEHSTGAITLKSVRDISADLQMDEFNTQSPLPREIRALLNKR